MGGGASAEDRKDGLPPHLVPPPPPTHQPLQRASTSVLRTLVSPVYYEDVGVPVSVLEAAAGSMGPFHCSSHTLAPWPAACCDVGRHRAPGAAAATSIPAGPRSSAVPGCGSLVSPSVLSLPAAPSSTTRRQQLRWVSLRVIYPTARARGRMGLREHGVSRPEAALAERRLLTALCSGDATLARLYLSHWHCVASRGHIMNK